jgi:hypothetical protein
MSANRTVLLMLTVLLTLCGSMGSLVKGFPLQAIWGLLLGIFLILVQILVEVIERLK